MKGYFSEETLDKYARLAAEKLDVDFAEGDLYDFTTCIRPDGSAYGTGGKCRKGTEGKAKEKKAIDQLGSMLPKGEKIMDSKGGLHTAAGAAKKPEEFGSFDKLTQHQRDRRIKQQAELVRDLKKDGNADWKSERGRLDRMLDKDKEVAAKKPEQSTADKAMDMVRAKMKARGQTEVKGGDNKPAAPASTAKKPAVQGYDWRKQSGTFRKADND